MFTPDDRTIELDAVQAAAVVYRALLKAFARPGHIADIREALSGQYLVSPEEGAVLLLATTLLDTEVSHYADLGDDLNQMMRNVTHSLQAPPEQADYLFIRVGGQGRKVLDYIRIAKSGTLEHPEENATLFIQVEDLAEQPSRDAELLLSGPGIQHMKGCSIAGIDPIWVQEREQRNAEYPLGLDVVFFTASGKLLALPRTTSIKEGQAHWDTYQ